MKNLAALALLATLALAPSAALAQDDPSGSEGFPPPPGEPITPDDAQPAPAVDLAQPSSTLYTTGYELFADGLFGTAALYFEELLRRKPDHPSARNYLVECYLAVGRDEDAAAVRDGAVPQGEATPAAEHVAAPPEDPEPEPEPELSEDERRDRRNPRRLGFAALALQVGGPSIGLGLWAEFKPHWFVSIAGGLGGIGVLRDDGEGGIGAGFVEAALMPVPLRVTPVFGMGAVVLAGPDVWLLDTVSGGFAGAGERRAAAYIILGLRYDARRPFFLSAGVGLIPTGEMTRPFLPYPGLRVGLRF